MISYGWLGDVYEKKEHERSSENNFRRLLLILYVSQMSFVTTQLMTQTNSRLHLNIFFDGIHISVILLPFPATETCVCLQLLCIMFINTSQIINLTYIIAMHLWMSVSLCACIWRWCFIVCGWIKRRKDLVGRKRRGRDEKNFATFLHVIWGFWVQKGLICKYLICLDFWDLLTWLLQIIYQTH